MREHVRRRIACYCDNVFEADMPAVVDLEGEPGAVEEVLAGSFMTADCPACGRHLAPEFPCRFTGVAAAAAGPGRTMVLQLVPESDRTAFLRGRLGYDIGRPDRVVIGMAELAEKLRVFRLGLDDRAVEILKLLLLSRSGQAGSRELPGAAVEEPTATFTGLDGNRLVFEVRGVRDGEVAIARLDRSLHDKVTADLERRLREEPASLFCSPPYVSVRRVEVEEG